MVSILRGDARRLPLADKSVDLVFTSPPYADARTYGIGAQRGCREWIDWMLTVVAECVRVSRGLVLVNCAGVTRDWNYWPACEGLLYRWWEQGGRCWRPAYWHRVGIPGSGGKQWLRADVEYVLAFTGCKGAIPWADNTANGHPPKWAPGGEMSYRNGEGTRRNQWGGKTTSIPHRNADGVIEEKKRPSHQLVTERKWADKKGEKRVNRKGQHFRHDANGEVKGAHDRDICAIANPGNLVKVIVGGGTMGDDLCHENEAPFPEDLAEWFVRGWCPPEGTVLDPFSGSGTTVKVAAKLGRHGIGIDLRASQCELALRRIAEVQPVMF